MSSATSVPRRLRDLGLIPGILPPGPLNALTDVSGVLVGHETLLAEPGIRTGVTAILPHAGNLFEDRVPVGNGFGKFAGLSQVQELGELETPILLTNTLSVAPVMQAAVDWTLARNPQARSVNAVVGETNDGVVNDIRARAVTSAHALRALDAARGGPVQEGCVGAGTGTVAFGWKGGIGTSSRALPASLGGFTVGVLAQVNFGGVLQVAGLPVGQRAGQHYLHGELDRGDGCELQRVREALQNLSQHRRVRSERQQLSSHKFLQKAPVLHHPRIGKAIRLPQFVELCGGHPLGLFAQQRYHRIARHKFEEQEHQHRDPERL